MSKSKKIVATVEELEKMKSNMFHTYKNMDELQTYFEKFSGSEKALCFTAMGLTVNTVISILQAHAK